MERGKTLSPSSLNSELTYFNNIREFVIDKGITELKLKDEERILRMLKGWMLERGYALSSKKYCPVYDRVKIESPGIIKHMEKNPVLCSRRG